MKKHTAELALNRFGFGGRGDEITQLGKSPEKWLLDQLKPMGYPDSNWNSSKAIEGISYYGEVKKAEEKRERVLAGQDTQGKRLTNSGKKNAASQGSTVSEKAGDDMLAMSSMAGDASAAAPKMNMVNGSKSLRKDLINQAKRLSLSTVNHAITTEHSFQARLLDFFSNHFSVSESNLRLRLLAPTLEREAIAPHLVGDFSAMLQAVESHPAMIIYLNNEQSAGPDTRAAKRKSGRGLNENLAREILELHTLGVKGGYQQADVRELAMAISGWSVNRPRKNKTVGFAFKNAMHQPGIRTVMGKRYAQKGFEQGKRILHDLALHPATAKHMSFKIARHFIADEPPAELVDEMTSQWLETKGNLKAVLTTMVKHPLSWQHELRKFKTPREFVISACRACERPGTRRPGTLQTLTLLGQSPFSAGSPAGFGDTEAAWDGAEALLTRIEWADHLSGSVNKDPLIVAKRSLGAQLTQKTERAIMRAESRQQGLALLLMSPEFQRR